ncbi:Hypothetical protein CFV354_0216 [Campylobacter fetus subsp. venerealis NCTC 10354]|nr:Hypothetical protein CFV354_0216 [Campylobacter fetus subsp. venerealis NCTC 10354]
MSFFYYATLDYVSNFGHELYVRSFVFTYLPCLAKKTVSKKFN